VRVLLDENLPHALAAEFAGHEVSSVQAEGWAGTENGALLHKAKKHFDALLSMDRVWHTSRTQEASGCGS